MPHWWMERPEACRHILQLRPPLRVHVFLPLQCSHSISVLAIYVTSFHRDTPVCAACPICPVSPISPIGSICYACSVSLPRDHRYSALLPVPVSAAPTLHVCLRFVPPSDVAGAMAPLQCGCCPICRLSRDCLSADRVLELLLSVEDERDIPGCGAQVSGLQRILPAGKCICGWLPALSTIGVQKAQWGVY